MRHQVSGKHLNRDHNHRIALFRNLITSLIENGAIETTEAKAKAVKGQVDKLITKAKKNTIHDRRLIGEFLPKRALVNKLVDVIAPNTQNRNSGFTRIVRLGTRRGDAAMMVKLEFVDNVFATKAVTTTEPKTPIKKVAKKTSEKTESEKTPAKVTAVKKPVKESK